MFKIPALTVVVPVYVFVPLRVSVPVPDLVIVPALLLALIIPVMLVLPVPFTVNPNVLKLTAPIVRRFPELLVQACAALIASGQLIVNVNALVLSTKMPRPAMPLIVLPASVRTKVPPMVTLWPTPVAIHIPPTVAAAVVDG